MAQATQYLVNEIFGPLGLVILDADDARLKRLFAPHIESDLFDKLGYRKVSGSIDRLNALPANYRIQVIPRELNFFYLTEGFRSRLVEEEGVFGVLDSDLRFSEDDLREELRVHPERFPPM